VCGRIRARREVRIEYITLYRKTKKLKWIKKEERKITEEERSRMEEIEVKEKKPEKKTLRFASLFCSDARPCVFGTFSPGNPAGFM